MKGSAVSPEWASDCYIAAGIVKQHKGTISVESTEGKETVFRFTILLNKWRNERNNCCRR